MAIKLFYDDEEETLVVYDTPAYLFNDARLHPFGMLAPDRGSRELDSFNISRQDAEAQAQEIVNYYSEEAHGINGQEFRPDVPYSERIYAVRTLPQTEKGEEFHNFQGDTIQYQVEHLKESEVPAYMKRRHGMENFDTEPLRELEWGDNVNYDEPSEITIVRVNDKKSCGKFVPLLKRGKR